jgi:NAD(P)-dependent dehydrogenase (short-subunit alcohol dehydrogenase family)
MTKAAIVNFTKGLSLDLIRRGIRVNSVAPGPVWTPLIPATLPPEKVEQFGADTPVSDVPRNLRSSLHLCVPGVRGVALHHR